MHKVLQYIYRPCTSGCHAWLNPLNPPFTRPGKADFAGSTFSYVFSSENAGIVRFPLPPHPLPRAADPSSWEAGFSSFFRNLLRAYNSLGISQPQWRHGRARWASSRPEVPERCQRGVQRDPPKTPQEGPKSGPRPSPGCSSCHFKNHRIPFGFYTFFEVSRSPQSVFWSPRSALGCSQSRFGGTCILFGGPGAS